MIDWTDELIAQVNSYNRSAVSYPGLDAYPVALPLPFTFDPVKHIFTFPMPSHRPHSSSDDRASLTLLHYDPQMANERFLLFYGQLNEQDNALSFTPSRVVIPQWGGRREE